MTVIYQILSRKEISGADIPLGLDDLFLSLNQMRYFKPSDVDFPFHTTLGWFVVFFSKKLSFELNDVLIAY